MNPGESQQELFREFSGETKKVERFPSLHRSQKPILINTSVEQLILCSILVILFSCLVFFLGVLRGKQLRPASTYPQRIPVPAAKPSVPIEQIKVKAPNSSGRIVKLPPAAAPQQAIVTDLSKPYTIQLVTYKKKMWAEKEVEGLRKNGYTASILTSGEYYLVCVGQYANIGDAKKDLSIFGAKYKDCFLRRR